MSFMNRLRRTAFWATGLLAPLAVKTVEGASSCLHAPWRNFTNQNQPSTSDGAHMVYMMYCDSLSLLKNVTSALAANCGAFDIVTTDTMDNGVSFNALTMCHPYKIMQQFDFGVDPKFQTYWGNSVCGFLFGVSEFFCNTTTPSPCVVDITRQTLLLNQTIFPNDTTMHIMRENYSDPSSPPCLIIPVSPELHCTGISSVYATAAGLVAGAIALGVGFSLFARKRRAEQLVAGEVYTPVHKMS